MKAVTGIQLTERDREILHFINAFGFCEMKQLNRKFNLKKPRNYQLLNRLVQAKLIIHERIFYHRPGIFRLTAKGAAFTELPPLAEVPLANYKHNILLTELYLTLSAQYPVAKWISERHLKWDKYVDGVGKYGHIADELFLFPEGKTIAIEVELTAKGKSRLEKILKSYGSHFTIDEVWYFCSKRVIKRLMAYQEDYRCLKVFDLEVFLGLTIASSRLIL